MTLTFLGTNSTPTYMALSSDIADNKISGAVLVGKTVFLTDTNAWKIISADLTLEAYSIPFSGSGTYNFISQTNATNQATLALTSGIDDTYQEYVVEFYIKLVVDQAAWKTELYTSGWLNSGYYYYFAGGYSNAYTFHEEGQNVSALTIGEVGSASGRSVSGKLQFVNPRTTDLKQIRYTANEITYQGHFTFRDGILGNTATLALSGVRFSFTNGNIASGYIRLYGMKNY